MKSLKKILFDTGLLEYLSETKNKVRGMLKTGYNPKIFWETWSRDFYNQKYQHKIQEGQKRILDEIRRLEPGSVLEAGCAFGRNLKFLSKAYAINMDLAYLILSFPFGFKTLFSSNSNFLGFSTCSITS